MPPIRPRDYLMPVGAFTMAIVLGFHIRSCIRAARDNAAVQREIGVLAGRRQIERERIGLVSAAPMSVSARRDGEERGGG